MAGLRCTITKIITTFAASKNYLVAKCVPPSNHRVRLESIVATALIKPSATTPTSVRIDFGTWATGALDAATGVKINDSDNETPLAVWTTKDAIEGTLSDTRITGAVSAANPQCVLTIPPGRDDYMKGGASYGILVTTGTDATGIESLKIVATYEE